MKRSRRRREINDRLRGEEMDGSTIYLADGPHRLGQVPFRVGVLGAVLVHADGDLSVRHVVVRRADVHVADAE